MKIDAFSVADAPPRGAVILRPTGRRSLSGDAAESRSITFIASDPSVGRDGHTIASDAWQIANFMKNPVVLFAHDDAKPPIGRVTSLRTVGVQLLATIEFATRDVYDLADTVYQLVKGGYLSAVSTGWIPLAWTAAKDRSRPGGLDFTRVELLEISVVPVPALPTALATARSAGIDVAPFGAWAERALDSRHSTVNRKELAMIRTAAGAAKKVYAAPRVALPERVTSVGVPDPASGFRSFGEYLQTVARASLNPEARDKRLQRVASIGPDPTAGGFMVPTTYIGSLIESIYSAAVIAPLCLQWEIDTDSSKIPGIDETSRADGSRWGGATAYWGVEAQTVSPSLPRYRAIDFVAKKLFALALATNELLADAPALGNYVSKAFSEELSFKLDAAILSGRGAGLPLGIMNTGALITVAKANGQQSKTIIADNIESMWQRMPSTSRRRSVWLVNEDAESQIALFNAATASPSTAGMYIPSGVAGNDWPLLKGRPLIAIEQAQPLGTPGDIVLADLTQYLIVDAGQRADLSMESHFDTDEGIFRFVWRVDGNPLWSSAVTPWNGSGVTRSPFVALAQR